MKEGLRRSAIVLKVFGWSWLVLWTVGGAISAFGSRTDYLVMFGVATLTGVAGFVVLWPIGWIVDGFAKQK